MENKLSVKLQVEEFLDQVKTVTSKELKLAIFNHRYLFDNKEQIYNMFNMFEGVTSFKAFKRMWKEANCKIYFVVDINKFCVIFDYNKQVKEASKTNVINLRDAAQN